MAQPKKPPVSLRVPDPTQQRVHAYAAERGIPRNAAYVELLDRALSLWRRSPALPAKPPVGGPT